MRTLILCLLLSGCATPRYHLTQAALDASIDYCLTHQPKSDIEVNISTDGKWAAIACVRR
jgi:hypothetical protein